MTTNAELIAGARQLTNSNWRMLSADERQFIKQLADALESEIAKRKAAEAQVAGLRAHLTYRGHEDDKAVPWPADLREAVRHVMGWTLDSPAPSTHDQFMAGVATLIRYGLLEESLPPGEERA